MPTIKASDEMATIGSFTPPGVIMPFGGATAPSGWFICNGSEKSETTYAALRAAIGTVWNQSTNPLTGALQDAPASGNFRIPNLQGVFLRSIATYAGADAYHSDNNVALAAFKVDKGQGHQHTAGTSLEGSSRSGPTGGGWTGKIPAASMLGVGGGGWYDGEFPPSDDTANGAPRYGKETIPKQIGVNYIIKY